MITVTITDSGEEFKLDPYWIEKVYRDEKNLTAVIQIKQQLNGIPPLKIHVKENVISIKRKIQEHYKEKQLEIFH